MSDELHGTPFLTSREELWHALIEETRALYIERDDGGRTYYRTMSDLSGAFWGFCDRKEIEASRAASRQDHQQQQEPPRQ